MNATSLSSSISANLGNSGETMVEIHTSTRSSNEEETNWPHVHTLMYTHSHSWNRELEGETLHLQYYQ